MARILFFVVVGYLAVLVAVYVFQRMLQYYPDKTPLKSPEAYGLPWMQEVQVQTEDLLSLKAWFVPPKEKDGKIIVMFHGNAGRIADRVVKAPYYYERGYGVLFLEYRGFGGNDGSPSEQGFYRDGRAAVKYLEGLGYTVSQMIIYGESIGSGVAVQIAQEIQPPMLILEAPFSSAVDVAKIAYFYLPVEWLMKDRYENAAKIGSIHTQLLIVHGDEDGTIPLALSKKLFEAANHPKEFVTIEGGAHNNLYEHHAGHIIADWIDRKRAETVP